MAILATLARGFGIVVVIFGLGLMLPGASPAAPSEDSFPTGWSDETVISDPASYSAEVDSGQAERVEANCISCDHCGENSCFRASDCRAARSGGIGGGADMLFLRPYFADGHPAGNLFGFEASPRFWLGYTTASGLGLRARYWDFDHRGGNEEDGTYRLDASVFDLELVDTVRLGQQWDAAISGGWRRVDFEFAYEAEPDSESSLASGNGLTAALELRRCLPRGFSIFGNFRAAWLFGDLSYRAPWVDNGRLDWSGTTQRMTEMQLGVEWRRPIAGNRADLMARAGVEAQWWDAFATNMDAPEMGLFGFFTTVGIRR